jgi:hypothetical protein
MQVQRWSLLFCLLLAGCGGDHGLAPVKGRVTLDGKPVEGAAVLFEPEAGGIPATGITDASGEFTLATVGKGEGASVGMNGVSVAKQVLVDPNRKVEEGEIVPMKSETPEKYASPRTSGITIEVKRGMSPVELELKSGK